MKSTTDIWLAAWLLRHGHPVRRVDKGGKRAKWCFEIDDVAWEEHKLTWSQDVDTQIKYTHETLKDLIHQ